MLPGFISAACQSIICIVAVLVVESSKIAPIARVYNQKALEMFVDQQLEILLIWG